MSRILNGKWSNDGLVYQNKNVPAFKVANNLAYSDSSNKPIRPDEMNQLY
jgi:hypothetical protein